VRLRLALLPGARGVGLLVVRVVALVDFDQSVPCLVAEVCGVTTACVSRAYEYSTLPVLTSPRISSGEILSTGLPRSAQITLRCPLGYGTLRS